VLAAAAGGCGSSGGAGGGSSAAPVPGTIVQAADRTAAAKGAHVALSGSVSGQGLSVPLSGSGEFSFGAGNEGSLTLTISGLPASAQAALHGSSLQLDEIAKGGAIYIGSPVLDGHLPGGARWLKVNISQIDRSIGVDPSSLGNTGANPAAMLQDLRAAGGTVRLVGHDTIRGVSATHYAASVDLVKAVEATGGARSASQRKLLQELIARAGLRRLPIDVWVGGGLVRRVALHIATHGITAALEVEYFDFGPVPPVSAPSPGEVFEVNSQALQGLTGSGSGSSGA
jgi:hypothetical protein